MKLFLFLALLSNMFFPVGIATTTLPGALIVGMASLIAKVVVLAVVVAVIESTNAKLRLFRVPEAFDGGVHSLAPRSHSLFHYWRIGEEP